MSEKDKKPEKAVIDIKPIIEYVDKSVSTLDEKVSMVDASIPLKVDEAKTELSDEIAKVREETERIPEGFKKETVKDDKTKEEHVVIRPEKPLASEDFVETKISEKVTPIEETIETLNVRLALPRNDAERAKAHFNISDENWNKLSNEQKQAYIDKLPARGSAEAKKITDEFSEIMNQRDEQYKENLKNLQTQILEAVWDTAYINDLPNSSFAYIEKGGKDDESGKTVPRSLRHLPFKDGEGNIDLTHLRNSLMICEALSRLPQTSLSTEAKEVARRKLCGAVDTYNRNHDDKVESAVCGTKKARESLSKMPVTFMPALIEHYGWTILRLTEKMDDANAKLAEFEDFMNKVVKPSHKARESLGSGNDGDEPTPEEKHRKEMRKLILGEKE